MDAVQGLIRLVHPNLLNEPTTTEHPLTLIPGNVGAVPCPRTQRRDEESNQCVHNERKTEEIQACVLPQLSGLDRENIIFLITFFCIILSV